MKHIVTTIYTFALLLPLLLPQAARAQKPASYACSLQQMTAQELEAWAAFHRTPDVARLPYARKNRLDFEIGDTTSFYIQATDINGNLEWRPTNFTLRGKSDFAYVWIETRQLTNNVISDEQVDELQETLLFSTPEASVNREAGILDNSNTFLGDPPDYDGDGRVDVLIYDIANPGVAGFVTSADQWPDAPDGFGNQADILYLDALIFKTNPVFMLGAAAHEYTHLIHYNYDLLDPSVGGEFAREHSFISEGLAEYGSLLNGYFTFNLLNQMTDPAQRNINLFALQDDDGGPAVPDYTRGALFFGYYGDRFGPEAVGRVLRNTKQDVEGLEEELNALGTSLGEFLLDFHTANLVNLSQGLDGVEDDRFVYKHPNLLSAGFVIDPFVAIDGNETNETPPATLRVQGGGTDYVIWQNVTDFNLTLQASASGLTPAELAEQALARVMLVPEAGPVRVEDLTLGETPQTFEGDYQYVGLIAVNGKPLDFGAQTTPITFTYSADWTGEITTQRVVYDDGQIDAFFFTNGTGFNGSLIYGRTSSGRLNMAAATRFDVPEGAGLQGVTLPIYYENANAPRNFELVIWDDDGSGGPGEERLSFVVDDQRAADGSYAFDLTEYELNDLPASIFVGFRETGDDRNFLVVPVSSYTTENVSFFGDMRDGNWYPLWAMTYLDISGNETVVPIRASFALGGVVVSAEAPGELPHGFALAQNFPNPFNPSTTIGYELAQAMAVKVKVYDVLGREVAVLVDGMRPAGAHEVAFRADDLPSGVYLYTLEAGTQRLARTMMLLK